MKTARLVLSIFSVLFALLIGFVSCSAALTSELVLGQTGGGWGMLTSFLMLTAGIIGIVTSNSKSKGAGITVACFYAVGGLISIPVSGAAYKGLILFSVLSFIFAAAFFITTIYDKSLQKGGRSAAEPS